MIDMLHDNISFEWRWNHWPLSGNAGIAKVLVVVSTLPMDSDGFADHDAEPPASSKLSVTITLSTDDKSRRRNETAQDQAMSDDILPQVDHATIMVTKKNGSKLDEHLWFNIFLLSKALASRSPQIKTLQIIAQESEVLVDTWTTSVQDTPKSVATKEFFPSPYESLAGLPLRAGMVHGTPTPKGHPRVLDSTTRKNLNLRPAHVRMDSCMGLVVKRREWVYSSMEDETFFSDIAHVE
jgi:hypothetical protein